MDPGALRRPEDGSQVVGIGDLVAHHHKGGLSPLLRPGQNVLQLAVFPHGRLGDDPLVGAGDAHGVQLPPVALRHHDAPLPGFSQDPGQGPVRVSPGHEQLVDGPSGPEGLLHRVAALDQVLPVPKVCSLLVDSIHKTSRLRMHTVLVIISQPAPDIKRILQGF